jgi:hypothetical protein
MPRTTQDGRRRRLQRGGSPVSIEWIVFGLVVAIGLVAIFGFALVKTVLDAQRTHRSSFLDLTTTTSISRTR